MILIIFLNFWISFNHLRYLNNCHLLSFSHPLFTCTKSAMKAPAHCVKPLKINNIINFEQLLQIVLVFPLLTLNK